MRTMFYPEAVSLSVLINVFFLYSFLGWAMECIVIRREKGHWENRGFAHSPFCIIYGFGSMLGYAALNPLADNLVLLFFVGALTATAFEYLVGRAMQRLFGDFWWDYSEKKFNYKGILCLESTMGWGLLALFVILFLHKTVFWLVLRLSDRTSWWLSFGLSVIYLVDFIFSAKKARREYRGELEMGKEEQS